VSPDKASPGNSIQQSAPAAPLRLLIVEDVPADAELEMYELRRAGVAATCRVVETADDMAAAIADFRPDVILSDFALPHFDGLSALSLAQELVPATPFIFVSGTVGEEAAIRALRAGLRLCAVGESATIAVRGRARDPRRAVSGGAA